MFQPNRYAYSSLSTKSERDIDVESSFDFSSIYSYKGTGWDEASNKNKEVTAEAFLGKLVGYIMLGMSYLMIFFSLPISVWFCFKNLPQWERLVIYRLGKSLGVKGPGTVFTIPWLDHCAKLDLRTRLIQHPVKQFLCKDQSIVEAGCDIHYRICDPAQYISKIRDPDLKGLKLLVYAITYKKMEACDVKEMGTGKKVYIEDLALKELNGVTTPWGIEISSVEIANFRVLKESEPINGVVSVMRQLGVNTGSNEEAPNKLFTDLLPETALTLAAKGFSNLVPVNSSVLQPMSQNFCKLEELINSIAPNVGVDLVACFKIAENEKIFIEFKEQKGIVYEKSCPREPDVIITLSRVLFESFVNERSCSGLLRAYLEGQISVEGDSKAIKQFQRILSSISI